MFSFIYEILNNKSASQRIYNFVNKCYLLCVYATKCSIYKNIWHIRIYTEKFNDTTFIKKLYPLLSEEDKYYIITNLIHGMQTENELFCQLYEQNMFNLETLRSFEANNNFCKRGLFEDALRCGSMRTINFFLSKMLSENRTKWCESEFLEHTLFCISQFSSEGMENIWKLIVRIKRLAPKSDFYEQVQVLYENYAAKYSKFFKYYIEHLKAEQSAGREITSFEERQIIRCHVQHIDMDDIFNNDLIMPLFHTVAIVFHGDSYNFEVSEQDDARDIAAEYTLGADDENFEDYRKRVVLSVQKEKTALIQNLQSGVVSQFWKHLGATAKLNKVCITYGYSHTLSKFKYGYSNCLTGASLPESLIDMNDYNIVFRNISVWR